MDRTSQSPGSKGSDVKSGGVPPVEPSAAQAGAPGSSIDPTEDEIEAWAERVRLRRQAWVDGPNEEERHEWQRRERARRLARLGAEAETRSGNGIPTGPDPYDDRRRLEQRYVRELRLAAEGLGVLMATLPFRVMAELVATGRDFEEGVLRPSRRRWIPFYDDDV